MSFTTDMLDQIFDTIVSLSSIQNNYESIKNLLCLPIEGHIHTQHGCTLLAFAIKNSIYPLKNLLVDRGNASFKNMDNENNTIYNLVYQFATSFGFEYYLKEDASLLQHMDFNELNNNNETILHSASKNNSTTLFFNYIIKHKDFNPEEHLKLQDKNGETCLFNLVICNRLEELKQCVQLNQKCIYICNNKNQNILDFANIYGRLNIFFYLNPFFSTKKQTNEVATQVETKVESKNIAGPNFQLLDHVKIKSTDLTGVVFYCSEKTNFVTIVLNNYEKDFIKNISKSNLEVIPKKELIESGDYICDGSKIQKGQLLVNDKGHKLLVINVDETKNNFTVYGLVDLFVSTYSFDLSPFKRFFWFA